MYISSRKFNTIILGSNAPDTDSAILVENCTKERWDKYEHVKGCPPTSMEIAEAISKGSLHGTIFVDD